MCRNLALVPSFPLATFADDVFFLRTRNFIRLFFLTVAVLVAFFAMSEKHFSFPPLSNGYRTFSALCNRVALGHFFPSSTLNPSCLLTEPPASAFYTPPACAVWGKNYMHLLLAAPPSFPQSGNVETNYFPFHTKKPMQLSNISITDRLLLEVQHLPPPPFPKIWP